MNRKYTPKGIFVDDPATGQRKQATRIRDGHHIVTRQGQRLLTEDFVDFTIDIPVVEQQHENEDHPFDPRPRDTYHTVSTSEYPYLEALLLSYLPEGTQLSQYIREGAVLPQGFKDELRQILDVDGTVSYTHLRAHETLR